MSRSPDLPKRRPWPSVRFWFLTAGLIAIPVAWPACMFLTFLGLEVLRRQDGSMVNFWLLWEIASIIVTLIVTIAFWGSCFMREDGTAIFEGARAKYAAFGGILIFGFAFGFVKAGLCAWNHGSVTEQMLYLMLGVVGTIGLQLLAMKSTYEALKHRKTQLDSNTTRKASIASEVRVIAENRDSVTKYLCFSDLPIAFAILCLAMGAILHVRLELPFVEQELRSFVAGAVAVQLLYSNFVFWLESFADYPGGHWLLGRLPPFLRSIRHMLHPTGQPRSDTREIIWAKSILREIFHPATRPPGSASSERPASSSNHARTDSDQPPGS